MKSVLLSVIGILSFVLALPVIAQEKAGAIAAAAIETIAELTGMMCSDTAAVSSQSG